MGYDIVIGRNKEDKRKFGMRGLINLGKGYVTMGQRSSLSNTIWLDVVRSHVILIAGKRGSGKSYTIGVVAEELSNLPEEIKKNIAPLIFDTMGIFWTMKHKNTKDQDLLEEWNLTAKQLPVKNWVPYGFVKEYESRGIAVDNQFALSATELTIEDWLSVFNLSITNPIAMLMQKALSLQKKNTTLDDIITNIKNADEPDELKKAAATLFEAAKSWNIFASEDQKETEITNLIKPGTTNILDLSMYASSATFNIRALVIGLISKKLFTQRVIARKKEESEEIKHGTHIEKETPLVWLCIDEAHEFLPKDQTTPASPALIQILREGRQPGISLVLATQQPGVIHRDVMTQSDIVLAHKLTNKHDLIALNEIMQSYLLENINNAMNNLPDTKGSAILLDDNSERLYPIRVRPRFTWHGGEAPKAMHEKI